MKGLLPKITSVPVGSSLCTGCTACASICPSGAIKMSINKEGFYAPTFNKELCTNCQLCVKACPARGCNLNSAAKEAFAVMVKDEEVRLSCSSGGVAYALSKYVIENDGYVCGCITQNFETYHEIISKENFHLFDKLRGSKYVQSDLRDVFVRIKKLLRNNKSVLFIGSGCQVAGLKKFLIKPYSNLITIDFICHGVPSPMVLNDYINQLKQKYYTATNYSTRDKIDGWQGHHEFNLFDDEGNTLFRENGKYNLYISSFLANYINRNSCGSCKYAKIERASDITVGDFWRIGKFNKEFDDKKGTSLVLCNSSAGQKLLESTKDSYSLFESVPIDFAKSVQPHLNHPAKVNANRGSVFDLVNVHGDYFSYLNKKIFKVGLLTFHFANDFGAVLIAYALQNTISYLGFVPEIINYSGKNISGTTEFSSFRERFLKLSESASNYADLCKVQKRYKKIIVGSNQVWRYFDQDVYMLKFASGEKNLISYAASFGKASYTSMNENEVRSLLGRFSAISVREQSGVRICKEQFGLPALRVIDPTLLLDAEDYQSIIDFYGPSYIENDYIGYSFSKKNQEQKKKIMNVLNKYYSSKISVKNIQRNFNDDAENTVGGWLNDIKRSSFIVTDSLHAVCLSIIYKRNFVCLISSTAESNPIYELLKVLGLTDRIIRKEDDFSPTFLDNSINYDDVYKLLEIEKARALNYLKNSLSKQESELVN